MYRPRTKLPSRGIFPVYGIFDIMCVYIVTSCFYVHFYHTFNSCNMGTSVLPNMCTLVHKGHRPEGRGCTYQTEHLCTRHVPLQLYVDKHLHGSKVLKVVYYISTYLCATVMYTYSVSIYGCPYIAHAIFDGEHFRPPVLL